MRYPSLLPAIVGLLALACDREVTSPPTRNLAIEARTALAPDQQATLAHMSGQIQEWIASGVLTGGQGNALLSKLQAAEAQLNTGNPAGANVLDAFVHQADAFAKAGILTAAQAALLTTPARTVIGNEILFTSIAAGDQHACGLASGGFAYCWGNNAEGQLGDGTTTASTRPVLVSATRRYKQIGAGSHYTCALTETGEVECWGNNSGGQLGNGSMTNRLTPTPVSGGHAFESLGVGGVGVCGLSATGAAWCWGAGGRIAVDFGGLATPATETCPGTYAQPWPCSTIPVQVMGGLTFASVDAGLWSGCGLTTSNAAYCWGWNQHFQGGNGTQVNASVPAPVSGGLAFTSLSSGAVHVCGIIAGGAAYCWGGLGLNWGQLGNGTTAPAPTPTPVSGGLSFRSIRPARGNSVQSFTCGVTTGGAAACWGSNTYGQLGTSTTEVCQGSIPCSTTPLFVDGGHAFEELSTGAQFACGVSPMGDGFCWGGNYHGQLGNGSTTDASAPVRIVR